MEKAEAVPLPAPSDVVVASEGTAKKKKEDDDGTAYLPLLLLLPAAIVLHIWDATAWAAWPALVVGALGVVSVPVAFVKAGRAGFSLGACLAVAIVTAKFLGGAWGFFF